MASAMKALEGKIALVTGASRGMGRGIALQLGQAGATVYVTGRSPPASYSATNKDLPTLEQTAKGKQFLKCEKLKVFFDFRNRKTRRPIASRVLRPRQFGRHTTAVQAH